MLIALVFLGGMLACFAVSAMIGVYNEPEYRKRLRHEIMEELLERDYQKPEAGGIN